MWREGRDFSPAVTRPYERNPSFPSPSSPEASGLLGEGNGKTGVAANSAGLKPRPSGRFQTGEKAKLKRLGAHSFLLCTRVAQCSGRRVDFCDSSFSWS